MAKGAKFRTIRRVVKFHPSQTTEYDKSPSKISVQQNVDGVFKNVLVNSPVLNTFMNKTKFGYNSLKKHVKENNNFDKVFAGPPRQKEKQFYEKLNKSKEE